MDGLFSFSYSYEGKKIMRSFFIQYRLANMKERIMLSQLGFRIKKEKIRENINVKVGWLKYITAFFAYIGIGVTYVSSIILTIGTIVLRTLKATLFLPISIMGGWNRSMMVPASIIILISPFALYFTGFFFLLSGNIDEKNQQFLLNLHQYRTAVAVRDEAKNLLGIMPNGISVPSPFIDRVYDKATDTYTYKKSYNRESSLYVDEIPDFFWDVIKEREHKQLSFTDEPGLLGFVRGVINRSYRGVDIIATMIKTIKRKGGGSTPMNAMIKNLYGYHYFSVEENRKFECPIIVRSSETFCRKWVEYRAARDLFPSLAQNNGREFKRWVSMHAPFVGSVGGNGLYGLQAAAAIMFGKKPKDLTRAEQSFIATSYLRDFRFSTLDTVSQHSNKEWEDVCNQSASKWSRTERWFCRKRVARTFAVRVIRNQYKGVELIQKLASLEKEFEAMARPKDPEIPNILRPFFYTEASGRNNRIKRYGNLRTRLDSFMPEFKLLVKKELQEIRAKHPSKYPVEIITTLPLNADYRFRKAIAQKFSSLEMNYPFKKRLSRNTSPKKVKKKKASIRISVTELRTGNVVRYYLQEGKLAVEEKPNIAPPLRPIASIAKIPLAMFLVNKGVKAQDRLCNQYYAGRQNAGGDQGVKDCSRTYTFEDSISRSKNLPLRYALSSLVNANEKELVKLFEDFDLTQSLKSEQTNLSQHLIENLSFGSAKASASNTHRIINSVAQVLVYKGNNESRPIHAIKRIKFISYNNKLQVKVRPLTRGRNKSRLSKVNKYLQGSERINTMKTLLSAPIRKPGGTLYFLRNIKNGKVLFGKTGTFDTNAKNIKDKYAVGVLKVNGKYYSFSILIGSEDYNGEGLINKIRTSPLIKPLVQEIVDSLYYEL